MFYICSYPMLNFFYLFIFFRRRNPFSSIRLSSTMFKITQYIIFKWMDRSFLFTIISLEEVGSWFGVIPCSVAHSNILSLWVHKYSIGVHPDLLNGGFHVLEKKFCIDFVSTFLLLRRLLSLPLVWHQS